MRMLPDVLAPDLRVIFCGTDAGSTSAATGAYYANPGNSFWVTLHRIGLTPHVLQPDQFHTLPEHGIGLTDLVKVQAGTADQIAFADKDVAGLRAKLGRFQPRALAFNGKRAAQESFGSARPYGRQPEVIGATPVFVLPSTSGAARGTGTKRTGASLPPWCSTDSLDGAENPSLSPGGFTMNPSGHMSC